MRQYGLVKLVLAVATLTVVPLLIWSALSSPTTPVELDPETRGPAPLAERATLVAAELRAPGVADGLDEIGARESPGTARAAVPPEPAPSGGPVHGRVLSVTSGAPQPGFRILHHRGTRDLAEVATDSEGRFVLETLARASDRVEVARRPGWRAVERRQWLTTEQAEGREPVDFLVDRVEGLPVRGRIVDAESRLPVADYTVVVRGPSRVEQTVVTDENGWFETPDPVEPGTVKVVATEIQQRLIEGRASSHFRALKLDHLRRGEVAVDFEVEVDLGPRVDLSLTGLEDSEVPLVAVLTDRPGGNDGLLSPVRRGRRGTASWARFTSEPKSYDRLEVRSEDGLWYGWSPWVDGERHIPIAMRRTGALQVHFVEESTFSFRLAREVEVVDAAGRAFEPLSSRSGRDLVFHHLEEGRYVVRYRPRGGAVTERTVEVVAGETSIVEFEAPSQE